MENEVEVDDIFKSFVNSKLKQLGIDSTLDSVKRQMIESHHGTNNCQLVTKDEDQSSTMQKIEEMVPVSNEIGNHKHKKKKTKKEKKKKHRKEKKRKKKFIDRNENDSSSSNHQFSNAASAGTQSNSKGIVLKKKILVDEEEEVVIKKKKLNCYHETVSKLKEIEQLPLNIESDLKNVSTKESVSSTQNTTCESIMTNEAAISCLNTQKVIENEIVHSREDIKLLSSTEVTFMKGVVKNLPEVITSVKSNKLSISTSVVNTCIAGLTSSISKTSSLGSTSTLSSNATTKDLYSNVPVSQNAGDATVKTNEGESCIKLEPTKNKEDRNSTKRRSSCMEEKKGDNKTKKSKWSRSSKRKRSRSRQRSPKRHKHHRYHRHRESESHRRHNKSASRHRRSPSPLITKQDKVKLLEIAKARVLAQHKAEINLSSLSQESKAVLRSGGVTLEQLTGVCQDIVEGKREVLATDGVKATKVHHPFQVKETLPISINLKNCHPMISAEASKPITELTKEFPVSCGSQHQRKEVLEEVYGKWEPILKDEDTKHSMKAIMNEKVFPDAPSDNTLAIKDVIAQRVSAVRELQNNPNDLQAMKTMFESQQKLDTWTSSKQIPGRFTGEAALQPLKKSELVKGQQAWANSDTLNAGKQVSGIGKCLLQKMGWKEGESLGKSNVGMLEPLRVNVKTDRKGLSSIMETPPAVHHQKHVGATNFAALKDFSGKHPVSALMEICSKRKWKPPDFILVLNSGPDHNRNFMFKVRVHDTFYQPSVASMNKKLAKAQAATAALQAMGLLSS